LNIRPKPPVAKIDRLGVEGVQLAGGHLVGHHAAARRRLEEQVQHLELVEEVDAVLDALLVERLQDHVAGAVGRVAGAAHRALPKCVVCPPKGRWAILPSGVRLNGRPMCSSS
jgi:hypothetical protein